MITQKSFSLIGSDGKTIYGDITCHTENGTGPVVLFIHGFKGFKDWGTHNLVARYFAQNGFRYVKFNLSHSGVTAENPTDVTDMETFANNTVSKELLDVDLTINFILEQLKVEKLNVIGHSRGGGLGIITAANNPYVSKLITWSAIAGFSSLWKREQEDEWRKNGKIEVLNARTKEKMPLNVCLLEDFKANKEKLNILAAAKTIDVPWLIVQGDDDVNVPYETAQQLANANLGSKLAKIEGANHVYGAFHPYHGENLPLQLFQVCEKSLNFLGEST